MSGGVLIYALLFYGAMALGVGVVIFLVITFVEAVILRFINWGDMRQSLRDSLMINIVTTIVGIITAITAFDFSDALYGLPDTFGEILPQMILLWAFTVLIEGILLGIIRKRSFTETWGATLIINTCSYVMFALIMPLLGFSSYL
jgi:hypothetical protein